MSINDRLKALMAHPLSQRSMNRAGMGALGTLCDISIEPGWVAIIEQLFAMLEELPEDERPVISQIKEKFGLRVYVHRSSPAADAAISFAEGQADRTCQVCGCRGSHRVKNGWYATMCAAHAIGNDEGPGEDVPLPHWGLHAATFMTEGREATETRPAIPPQRRTRLELINLDTGKGPMIWDYLATRSGAAKQAAYLAGRIEPESTVIALDPVAVLDALDGAPLPFTIQSATLVLTEMAIKAGRDLTVLSHRLEIAAAGTDDVGSTAKTLASTWRWINGLPGGALAPITNIIVTGLARAKRIKRRGFTGVLSFINLDQVKSNKQLRFNQQPAPEHLSIVAEDIDVPDGRTRVPTLEHIAKIIELGRRHIDGNLLIHCQAGVARSSAAALAIIADRLGPDQEDQALEELLRLRPCAVPNLIMVALIDQYLERGGRLLKVVREWDAASPWCQWRRAANAAAATGKSWPPMPKGLVVPGDGVESATVLVENRSARDE